MASNNTKNNKTAKALTPSEQLAALREQLAAQQAAVAEAEAQIEQVEDAARIEREDLISSLPEKLGVDSLATVMHMVSAMVKHGTIKPAGRSLKDGERKAPVRLTGEQVVKLLQERIQGAQWSVLSEKYGIAGMATIKNKLAAIGIDQVPSVGDKLSKELIEALTTKDVTA